MGSVGKGSVGRGVLSPIVTTGSLAFGKKGDSGRGRWPNTRSTLRDELTGAAASIRFVTSKSAANMYARNPIPNLRPDCVTVPFGSSSTRQSTPEVAHGDSDIEFER